MRVVVPDVGVKLWYCWRSCIDSELQMPPPWLGERYPGILSTTFRLQPEVNSTISACSRHGSDVDSIHDVTSMFLCLSRAANWEVALALLDWHVRDLSWACDGIMPNLF